MELLLLAFLMNGGEQHAAGLDAHHRARRDVHDCHEVLAHELLRLIEGVDAGENGALGAGAVVKREAQELLAFLDRLAGTHAHDAHVGLGKRLKVDALRDGNKLPQFTATDLNGRPVSNADLKAPVNIITTWSSWNYESINLQRQLQNRFRQAGSDMKILSICLDADINDCRRRVTRDSVKWSTVCDGRMWESPVLNALGLAFVPDNIVTDASGKILAHGLQNRDLLTKIDNLLPKKPND